ncbi:MAG: peptidoglycan-binding domain-containing protein [Eubacteriales bacterium]|nr:peptidoglycan-binding domain-containing protein [Eubacteriales bacterium]
MRPMESFVGQPIRSLQTMLRVISENDESYPTIVPDGIYGPELVEAVSIFQRTHGLPVTGVTDLDTWEAVVAVFHPARTEQARAQTLEILLNPSQVIRRGQWDPTVYLVQAILLAMSEIYHSIEAPGLSGILDEATASALASFQSLSSLPATGHLDKHTWKHLALQFPLASNLGRA